MFLKAVGLGLSVPFAMKLARVATAQPDVAPKRFFLLYVPHGTAPEHYAPRVAEDNLRDFALDQTNESILGPLEPYKQLVNVYEGFCYVGTFDTHNGIVNCLSGVDVEDTTSPRTSIEHVIANELGVKPLILGACAHQPYGLDSNGMLFWNGTVVEGEKDPSKAADELFGHLDSSDEPKVDVNLQLRQELLSLTAAEIESLSSELNGLTREQNKLQAHLSAIQTIQAQGELPQTISCTTRPDLPLVEQVRSESFGQVIDVSGGNDYFFQEANFPLIFQAHLDLVAQALICNAAPVIALQPMYATCDFDFAFAGAAGPHHNGLSHTAGTWADGAQYDSPITVDNLSGEGRVPFAVAQRWFTEQLVTRVVSLLAETDDPSAPGTTVLDNTIIYVMSEIGDGNDHGQSSYIMYPQVPENLPLVTIGGAAGALSTGQVIRYELGMDKSAAPAVNRPAPDLYLTLARAMGVSGAAIPNTTGPVTEALT